MWLLPDRRHNIMFTLNSWNKEISYTTYYYGVTHLFQILDFLNMKKEKITDNIVKMF